MRKNIDIAPMVIKKFIVSRCFGKWAIFGISNGGLNIPVNDDNGLMEFDTADEAENECDIMNKERQIEMGN